MHNFMDKRGLSAVVTTLIMILLVLVAVGIVWVVIQNVVESGTGQVEVGAKCLDVDVRATNVATCGAASCTVTIKREAGGEDIGGVKLVFSNTTSGSTSNVVSVAGNINQLETKTSTVTYTMTPANVPDKVDVNPYFVDNTGTEQICPQSRSFNF